MSKASAKVIDLHKVPTLDELVRKIHSKFQEALDSGAKAYRARLAAGRMLLELRGRIKDGEAGHGIEWWPWYEQHFVRSRRDAEKVMALANAEDPEAAAEVERVKAREGMRRSRAANVSRSDNEEEQPEGDIIERALQLVAEMTPQQRKEFIRRLQWFL